MKKLMVILAMLSLMAAGCNTGKNVDTETTTKPAAAAPEKPAEPKAAPVVVFQTSVGDFEIQMEPEKAPKTVANFLHYVKKGFYDGTVFHRIVNDPRSSRVIQGGGMTKEGFAKQTDEPVENEADNGLKNTRGTISMARTRHPHSATSQFFINTANNAGLDYRAKTMQDYGYCVFGKVIEGMDVVDKIQNAPTTPQPHDPTERSVPINPVVIKKAYIK